MSQLARFEIRPQLAKTGTDTKVDSEARAAIQRNIKMAGAPIAGPAHCIDLIDTNLAGAAR